MIAEHIQSAKEQINQTRRQVDHPFAHIRKQRFERVRIGLQRGKPKAPAPPLIECTARKIALTVSASCVPAWHAASPASAAASDSSHSTKNIC
jgi:hypothetical protein